MRQAQRRRLVPLSFLLFTAVSGCASIRPPVLDPQADPFLIRFEELHAVPYPSAYEAVEDLRPLWIRSRGRMAIGGPRDITVYLDEVHFGTLQSLMSVPTGSLEAIEWVDAATATERWGKRHATAAIEVRTRR
jgi:hypothetical protein